MLGQRIADPRVLSDELGDCDEDEMYAGLASYSFGAPRHSPAPSEHAECISPLTLPRLSPDRTPRPSIVSSHPSHRARPFSTSSPGDSDGERSPDPIIAPYFSPHRAGLMSDTASNHTFGRASHAHGFTAASHDPPSSSSSVSVTTSRSSSRASMRTTEQFSSDEELEIDYYDDGNSSPVTFARYDLVDIDEDPDFSFPRPPSSFRDSRRGSLPMAIPGADSFSIRSREGSVLTVRRPSRSWDDSSVQRLPLGGDEPSLILPKSEPLTRADWHSLEVQLHAKQQQQQQQQQQEQEQQQSIEPNAYEGLDLQYILSKRSEGSIRSVNSRLSFVDGFAGPRRSSPHLFRGAGSTTTLPFEDTFMRHIQKHDRAYDAIRFYWSFLREKADASNPSSRRRQQLHHRSDKSRKDATSRVQEMWRCGHVGRFKVDKIVFHPQSADPAKGAQQRIHVRHIPDPFLIGGTTGGPHSVIHKHSRAVAFSIFRSHSLFSGRQAGGTGPANTQTHMNMRLGIMLAPKKVQEQYTSTKTTRQLSTHGLLDSDSRTHRRGTQSLPFRERDARDKSRRQVQMKSDVSKDNGAKAKDKTEKKHHLESTESSSAGSVTTTVIKHVVASPEQPVVRIQLAPSISSSTSASGRDSSSRPVSPSSPVPSTIVSPDVPESETSSVRLLSDHRDSIDSVVHLPTRTTHAEAFSALDPNDIESLRAKANSRANAEAGSLAERLFRVFRGNSKADDHPSGTQSRAFQPPWMTTAGRDKQEENDRVLSDLNASFRDVGLLHTNPHRSSKTTSKRKVNQGIFDQVPDDSLYMLLPLWPGETDTASTHIETSSTTSFVTIPENRRFLLVYYVPFEETKRNKKSEKKKAKHSHSSESGAEPDPKAVYLPAFRAVARVITYDELRLSGVRVPSDGLAISGPEWEALSYASLPLPDAQMPDTVVCQCLGRDSGFDFLQEGLLILGLCTQEDAPGRDPFDETDDRESKTTLLTPIGRAAVEMIWLGCLAITSFGCL